MYIIMIILESVNLYSSEKGQLCFILKVVNLILLIKAMSNYTSKCQLYTIYK